MRKLRRARQRHARTTRRLGHSIVTAGTAAAISLSAGAAQPAVTPDVAPSHQTPVHQDTDGDQLNDREELAIGYHPYNADQNQNQIHDGVELARHVAAIIDRLPVYEMNAQDVTGLCKVSYMMRGVESCGICGEMLNMGFWRIVNTEMTAEMDVPVIALHFMKHGSFDYWGSLHGKGRSQIAALLHLLEVRLPFTANEHILPLDGPADHDADLLTDVEEARATLNRYDADQNRNLLPDGVDLAKRAAEVINQLPTYEPDETTDEALYRISHMFRGIETCGICGEMVNMGFYRIVSETKDAEVDVPVIALHFLKHGSFSYWGSVHNQGRAEVAALLDILELPQRCGDPGVPYRSGDLNGDCRIDVRDLEELLAQWLDEPGPDQP
jgi:hypothetical protein